MRINELKVHTILCHNRQISENEIVENFKEKQEYGCESDRDNEVSDEDDVV